MALGGALGALAVMTRQELVLAIMGGVFVMETLSVIVQVASFKLTGKRVFRMAPIHHHFELKGWPEPPCDCAFLDSDGGVGLDRPRQPEVEVSMQLIGSATP